MGSDSFKDHLGSRWEDCVTGNGCCGLILRLNGIMQRGQRTKKKRWLLSKTSSSFCRKRNLLKITRLVKSTYADKQKAGKDDGSFLRSCDYFVMMSCQVTTIKRRYKPTRLSFITHILQIVSTQQEIFILPFLWTYLPKWINNCILVFVSMFM